ncbi:hypothetical protein HPB50_025581 [Hyalomma asiaticum]|uniref:Uncharacterized protein n=1 Tax=Hyalomma asiaticum TaxID=266040 RepID=A0ACB7SR10_HYAAI|nr:hypothetical protein HPB50_025581 [Hyalomma asiaticum]
MSKSKVTTTLILSFSTSVGRSTKQFVYLGRTVNAPFYKEVLGSLHRAAKRKRLQIANSRKMHYDSAPAHTALVVTAYLDRIRFAALPQSLNIPDAEEKPERPPFRRCSRNPTGCHSL